MTDTNLKPVVIELRNVSKKLGGRTVLDGVSLEIRKGETMCILGGSGAGKSVMLKHIVRLLQPDEGYVKVFGTDVTHAGQKELREVRKRIGFLFQGAALLNSINVYENVALPLREHENMKESEIQDLVREKLELVNMGDALEKMPGQLSGGMKKRAGLARAIIRNPDIILYDEPTAGLDPVVAGTVNDLILEMQAKINVTSIIVTHDMSSCMKVSNRIAFLLRGRIHRVGTPEEMKKSGDPIIEQFVYGDSEGPLTREPKK